MPGRRRQDARNVGIAVIAGIAEIGLVAAMSAIASISAIGFSTGHLRFCDWESKGAGLFPAKRRSIMPEFVKDLEAIRRRAERKIEEGAVTESYRGDVEHTIKILNEALATEIVCVLRYMHHYFMATGVHGTSVSDEFKEHADAEREHADKIAERIQQLGGKPDFNPRSLMERSVSQYVEGETLADMIREDLIAERIVIEVYQEMVRYFANNDPTTRHMVEEILADEEEHASDLADLLYIVDPASGKTEGQDPGTRPLQMEQIEREKKPVAKERGQERESQKVTANAGRAGRGGEKAASEPEEVLQELQREQRGGQGRQQGGGERRGNRTDLKTAGIRVGGPSGRGPATSGGPGQSAQASSGSRKSAANRADAEPTPGASGRPMHRRGTVEEMEMDSEPTASGGQLGGTRKVAVTNKKNTRRVA
jgi:bacterioferritin